MDIKKTPLYLDNDEYFEPISDQLTDEICPDCGSQTIYSMNRQFGPDDYIKQWECKTCGSTWEE